MKYDTEQTLIGILKFFGIIAALVFGIFVFFYAVTGEDRTRAKLPEKTLTYRIYYTNMEYEEKSIRVVDYKVSSSRGSNSLCGWVYDHSGLLSRIYNCASYYSYEDTTAPIRIMSFK